MGNNFKDFEKLGNTITNTVAKRVQPFSVQNFLKIMRIMSLSNCKLGKKENLETLWRKGVRRDGRHYKKSKGSKAEMM